MKQINELNDLMIELIENTDVENQVFSKRAREIIDEISDYAEQCTIYKENKEKGEKSLVDATAWQTYVYLLDRIVNAPFTLFRNSSVILLMPILRQKLREEGEQ